MAAAKEHQPGTLLRVLGTWFGIAAVIGGVIGVGILRVPSTLAADLGDPRLFIGIWFVGAAVAALGANCVAELAVMLPKAGGPYVYVQRAYGDYPGFLIGWIDFAVQVGSGAFILVALGEYGSQLAPAYPGGPKAIGISAIFLLLLIHAAGLRAGSGSQKLLSAAKALAFAVIVIICLIGAPDKTVTVEQVVPGREIPPWTLILLLGKGAVLVNETFAGWNAPVYCTEENRQPDRSIPRALFGGIAIVAAIYILVNVALLSVLPLERIAQSKLPLADAMGLILGPTAGAVVSVIAVVALLSICHANLFQTPRVLLALSRDGWFHSSACVVSEKGALLPALFLSVAAMVLLSLTGTFEELFISIALLSVAMDALVYSSVLQLRRTEPELPRPYRAKGYPWLPILVVGYVVTIIIATAWTDPGAIVRGGLTILVSVPAYFWLRSKRQPRPHASIV